MVATLLKLRFLILGNTLRRHPWQLVGMIFLGLYGLFILGLAIVGLVALRFLDDAALARDILVVAGSLLVLGWAVGPLLRAGADDTLDPARFRHLPIGLGRLLVATAIAGVLGIPGIITTVVAAGTAVTWSRSPLAFVAALVSVVLAVVTCVLLSRLVTALAAGLSARRRFREIVGIIVIAALILAGPILVSIGRTVGDLGVSGKVAEIPGRFAPALSWTPLGAVWAFPGDVAAGELGLAALHLLLAAVYAAAIAWFWFVAVRASQHSAGGSRDGARKAGLGAFGVFPANPAGAIAARSLQYWLRDPRYSRQLIIVPLLPVLFIFYGQFGGATFMSALAAPLVALSLSLAIYTDVSYDGSAFAAHVSRAVRGRDDRLGRAAALLLFGFPAVVLTCVLGVAVTGAWANFPALFGASLGVLLTGVGVASVSSAITVMPVVAAGENPFKSAPGAGMISMLSSFAVMGALVVLSLPGLVIGGIAFFTGNTNLGFVALGVGVLLGAVFLVVGIVVGGRILDRNGARLLARVSAYSG